MEMCRLRTNLNTIETKRRRDSEFRRVTVEALNMSLEESYSFIRYLDEYLVLSPKNYEVNQQKIFHSEIRRSF